MNTLEQAIKNLSVNHKVETLKAISLVKRIDAERLETVELLKICVKQVGMTLGEDILKHIAGMEGTRFNSTEYHYESMPKDQRQ
jgi:hypothetical protein